MTSELAETTQNSGGTPIALAAAKARGVKRSIDDPRRRLLEWSCVGSDT
jgi:hypothetical protein